MIFDNLICSNLIYNGETEHNMRLDSDYYENTGITNIFDETD